MKIHWSVTVPHHKRNAFQNTLQKTRIASKYPSDWVNSKVCSLSCLLNDVSLQYSVTTCFSISSRFGSEEFRALDFLFL